MQKLYHIVKLAMDGEIVVGDLTDLNTCVNYIQYSNLLY